MCALKLTALCASGMLERVLYPIMKKIYEQPKAQDQMAWVGAMNNIRNCAEEMVLREIAYR